MQCNNPSCRSDLNGTEFLITSCGHAFCETCSDAILRNARCTFCECVLTNEDVSTCLPNIRGQNSMALCGYDPSTILALSARFCSVNLNLRATETSPELYNSGTTSPHCVLRQSMKNLMILARNIRSSRQL
eukprot:24868-Hanusia_phi.AAC.4